MIEAVLEWLTSVPVAIWGSIIAGTMTLIGVLLGQYLLERRRERQKEEELEAFRDALIVELRAYDDVLKELLYAKYDMDKFREEKYALTDEQYSEVFESDPHARLTMYVSTGNSRSFSDEIFRSNADKIGELDTKTARIVLQAYDQMRQLDSALENLSDSITFEELMLIDSDVDWESGAGLDPEVIHRRVEVEGQITPAILSQKYAIGVLDEDEITKDDRELVVFAHQHSDPKSEQQAETKQFLESYMDEYDLSSPAETVEHNHGAKETESRSVIERFRSKFSWSD
ncbi:hypothetical protein [Natronococcus occultus]|uniref:hypothetical protein n=1 Tax=Natronococcus occultus TaxID=29288 RepID=UPI0012F71628|nr:hypothetical protein [Natronococcus occultus]